MGQNYPDIKYFRIPFEVLSGMCCFVLIAAAIFKMGGVGVGWGEVF